MNLTEATNRAKPQHPSPLTQKVIKDVAKMGLVAQLKTFFLLQLLMGYIFVVSGLIVNFLMLLTYIFVWPFNKTIYRKMVVMLAYSHWCQFTFLAQWWAGSDCVVYMENMDDLKYIGRENVIAIMNHKYDIDWLMSWILAERFNMLGGTKVYGKQSLKFVPLIGWAWIFVESIFLKREWDKDKTIISRDLNGLVQYPEDYWVTLLLFCEGTRFTKAKQILSNEIARKKGRPELKHHLLPRTKGFVHSMHAVHGKFPAILDLTVGFRKDGAEPTLMNIVNGRGVNSEMFVKRIPLATVPMETDEACSEWLHEMYQKKDLVFDNFVQNDGHFTIGTRVEIPKRINDAIVWCVWAVLLVVPLFYYLYNILISGSIYMQLGFVLFCIIASFGVRALISVSEIESSGSTYGKATNGTKKTS